VETLCALGMRRGSGGSAGHFREIGKRAAFVIPYARPACRLTRDAENATEARRRDALRRKMSGPAGSTGKPLLIHRAQNKLL
jgi:hypothetical protein